MPGDGKVVSIHSKTGSTRTGGNPPPLLDIKRCPGCKQFHPTREQLMQVVRGEGRLKDQDRVGTLQLDKRGMAAVVLALEALESVALEPGYISSLLDEISTQLEKQSPPSA